MSRAGTVTGARLPPAHYLDALAEFAAGLDLEEVPASAREACQRILLDTLGVIVGAAPTSEVSRLAGEVAEPGGAASLLGHGLRGSPEMAALVNGTAANWLELDEGNHTTLGHVGIHVLPAALALAEAYGRSGRDLLAALLAGYEVGARLARLGRVRWTMHPHGTWGAMAGAVAGGRLAGLPAPAIRQALGIAASLALVTSRRALTEGASVKYLWTGVAGQLAVQAVRFARCGFTSESDGPASLFASIGESPPAGADITSDLGARWEVDHAYFKVHACCRYAAPSVDAVLEARARAAFDPDAVAAIEVETFALAARLDALHAHHELPARFSVPYCVAAAARLGSCGPEAFRADIRSDPRVLELARRVRVHEVPALTAMFPAATPARVAIVLAAGEQCSAEVRHAVGDPERPLDGGALARKFEALAGGVLGPAAAAAVARAIAEVEHVGDVRALAAALRGDGVLRRGVGAGGAA